MGVLLGSPCSKYFEHLFSNRLKMNLIRININMKNVLIGLSLLCVTGLANAQNGLEQIIVEKYYVSDAADAAGSIGTLPVGSVTYRIYADMLPGYRFQAAYGVPNHELRLETTTSFFNNEDRGGTTASYSKSQAGDNSVMLDSWFSVGKACTNNFGILKSEDNGVSTVVNNDGMLQNNDPSIGIPLTLEDGLIAGTPDAVTFVGFLNTDLDPFDATSQAGNLLSTFNASWACLNGAVGPDTIANKVLIAQITTEGTFCFKLNIQIGTPSGGVENYVESNPSPTDITIPSLNYCSSVSINEVNAKANKSFVVYPNPTKNSLSIDFSTLKSKNSGFYIIYDISGKAILNNRIIAISNKTNEVIDVTSLTAGTYFMELTVDGISSLAKFIISE